MTHVIEDELDQYKQAIQQKRVLVWLALTMIIMLVGMSVYEFGKQLILPNITILQSQLITIVFSSTIASIAAYLVLRKYRFLLKRIIEEITERQRIEEELTTYREHLEELVKDQTAALKQTNEQLEKTIIEHKRVEEALRKSEERFRTLADFTYDWEYWLGTDGNYIYISPSCERITGYPPDEFSKNPGLLETIIHPDDHKIINDHICKELENDKAFSIDFRLITRSGQIRWISHACQTVYSADGNWQGRRVSNRDITERKQMEERLKEREEHYRTLFENSPISLWEEDFSNVKAYIDSLRDSGVTNFRVYFENHPDLVAKCAAMMKVVHINKVTLNLYKARSKEEFEGDLNKVFTQESYKGFKEELIAIAEDRTVFEREGIDQTLTGERIHFDLRWSVVPGYERTFSKVLVSIVDITERKQTERRLKHTMAELERSNAELEQFAYVASHDLQQPLLILDCYVQLLAQRYKGKLDSEADDFIARLIEGVDRMQTMIKELLDYSRLDAKSTDFQQTDCGMVFGKAIANLQATIDKYDVVITHDPFPIVMAKDFLLVQLFQNLISNAIKFRSKEVPRIHVSVDQQENAWLFSVQDNGIGFDPRYTEQIFTLFERIHDRRKYPGTGIGLAICKKIVERHGGRIWGESVPGKGATFYFTIPRMS